MLADRGGSAQQIVSYRGISVRRLRLPSANPQQTWIRALAACPEAYGRHGKGVLNDRVGCY